MEFRELFSIIDVTENIIIINKNKDIVHNNISVLYLKKIDILLDESKVIKIMVRNDKIHVMLDI